MLDALHWIEDLWDSRRREHWARAVDRWYASLPAFRGATPPDFPEPPED